MVNKNDISTHCVVRDSSHTPGVTETQGRPRGCQIVDSVQRLMSLGLSEGEIEKLGVAENDLEALCEYARLNEIVDGDKPHEAVGSALETLADETRKVDLELEMLKLRKRALSKRGKLLHKLSDMLQERGKV